MGKNIYKVFLLVVPLFFLGGCHQNLSGPDKEVEESFVKAQNRTIQNLNKDRLKLHKEGKEEYSFLGLVEKKNINKIYVDKKTGNYYFLVTEKLYKDSALKKETGDVFKNYYEYSSNKKVSSDLTANEFKDKKSKYKLEILLSE